MGKVTEKVTKLAKSIVKTQDLELVDVDYLKEGDSWVLRVFIENPDDELTLEHCENISKMLSERLDKEDPIDQSYILEVSSPGVERPLKTAEDFKKSINKYVRVKTFAPINGEKEFIGKLLEYDTDKEQISIEFGNKGKKGVVQIPFTKIAHTHLTIEF